MKDLNQRTRVVKILMLTGVLAAALALSPGTAGPGHLR